MATGAWRSLRRRADRRRRQHSCVRMEWSTITGRRAGAPWSAQLPLSAAANEPGVGVLWARAKIEALSDAQRGGEPEAAVRNAIVEVALAHHLVSKYTSLVAVDVTPTAPPGTIPATTALPTNLPEGWSYDAVFGAPQTATPATLALPARHDASRARRHRLVIGQGQTAGQRTLTMSIAADRGGSFYRRSPPRSEIRNWMRASPPGIARRQSWVESSPIGGHRAAAVEPHGDALVDRRHPRDARARSHRPRALYPCEGARRAGTPASRLGYGTDNGAAHEAVALG